MEKKLPIELINDVADLVPAEAIQDILARMDSWKSSGGKDDDPYMYQQARYAQNWAEKTRKEQANV